MKLGLKIVRYNYETYRKHFKELVILDSKIFIPDLRWDKEIFMRYIKKKSVNFIVKDGDNIIGYCTSFPFRNYFYICGVGLLSKYRGKGLGSKLVSKSIKEGKKMGFNIFRMDTINPIVLKLGENFGFKIIKVYKEKVAGKTEYLLEMRSE